MFRSLQLRNDRSKRFGETSSVQSSSGDGDDESDPRWRFPNDNRSIHSNFSSVRDTDDDSVVEEDCIGATTSIASSGSDHDEKSKVNARKPRQGFSPSPQSPRRISNKLKGILRRNKSLNSDDDDESSASPFDRSNNKKNNSVKNCSPRRRRSSLYSKHSITSSCADSAAETKTTSEMLMLSSSFGTALDASWRSSDNSSGMVQSPSSRQKQQKHKRVHHHVLFSFVEIREYVRIVGDNPSVSSGPPMRFVRFVAPLFVFAGMQLLVRMKTVLELCSSLTMLVVYSWSQH